MYHPSAVSCGQNHNVFTCILHIGCIPICYGTVYRCNRALVRSGAYARDLPQKSCLVAHYGKVLKFFEGHKILRNLHLTFVLHM